MLSASIRVLSNRIQDKIKSIAAAAEKARDISARATLDEARRRAPVGKTQAIRDGLQIRQLEDGRVAVGVWDVREANFQEDGTSRMHAHPYMRPGAAVGGKALQKEAGSRIRTAAEE